MKLLVPLLMNVVLCATAVASPEIQRLAGVYRLASTHPDRHMDMRLDCGGESACTVTTRVESDVQSAGDLRRLNVKARVNPVQAMQALEFVGERLDRPFRDEALAAATEDPRRWVPPDSEPARCWDLHDSAPGRMLVCWLTHTAARPTTLFLVAALPRPCDEAFCGYVIESPTKRIR